jgi:succinate dehydrogenase/fumarate reductase flavoprotein subunit
MTYLRAPGTADEEVRAADVLVIGGGLAGTWAAITAAREGASVVLAEKGYCGTSGVAATAGPGHWWVPPDPALREAAVSRRAEAGLGLADPHWMHRILETTWTTLPTLAGHYQFPVDDRGVVQYRGLRGPEYLRALRRLTEAAGVSILDHAPALELLLHGDGSAAGARLWRRQARSALTIRAGAVVLATGGCAFRSHLLGAGNLTGDGLLMAVEAGATLSGMEFTGAATVAPARTTMTRSMSYAYATYFDAAGREIAVRPGPEAARDVAAALLRGRVFCHLGRMPADIRARLRRISPNVPLVFDRLGIDPFTDRFEVTVHGEGTVRGNGGLRVADAACQTEIGGLFVAGDAASREPVAGAISGGGAQNSAWALSSGIWAGRGAAARAVEAGVRGRAKVERAGKPARPGRAVADPRAVVAEVRTQMLDIGRMLFRTEIALRRSLQVLDGVWDEVAGRAGTADSSGDPGRAREAAALVACGRWAWSAALARTESRGLHQRVDFPARDPAQAHRLVVGGLDAVWVRPEAAVPARERAA